MEWVAASVILVGVLVTWGILSRMQARLGRVESRLNLLLRQFNIDPAPGSLLSDRVRDLAEDPARKIEAIKVYCEETGAGLAEAKAAVESYINGH
jgi:sirohydrochlorin ferrochelatase